MVSGGDVSKGTLLVAVEKTQLGSNVITPSKAREILNCTPYAIPITYTADKEMLIDFSMESDDVDLAPTKIPVYASPGEDAAITTGANAMILQTYDIHAPISDGYVIKNYGTNINDPTTDPNCGIGFQYIDHSSGKQQTYYTSAAATTAYGTGNDAFVEGSTYRFNNVSRITRCAAIMAMDTQTISDSIGGSFKLDSSDFRTNLPQIYPFSISYINAVALTVPGIIKTQIWNVDIPCDPVVALTESIRQEGTTLAGDAQFMTWVGYNKTRRR